MCGELGWRAILALILIELGNFVQFLFEKSKASSDIELWGGGGSGVILFVHIHVRL